MPVGVQARSAVDALIAECDDFVAAGLALVAADQQTRSWGVGQNATKSRIKQYERACTRLSESIDRGGGRYLAGPDMTLADVAYWPFMERFLSCAKEFSDYDASAGLESVQRWIGTMQQRDAVVLAAPDAAAFIQAMHKHACLDWFDYSTSAAMELHAHLKDAGTASTR